MFYVTILLNRDNWDELVNAGRYIFFKGHNTNIAMFLIKVLLEQN